MARFEMILSIAKRSSERELYTEETKYVCFCENLKDLSEITDTANEVIQDELEDSEEGEVLFGSADVIVNDLTILMLQYTNSQLPKKEIDEIETLSKNISRLEIKIDELFDQDEMNPKYIDSLTKLAKEVRESLRYLMEFKGKLVHKRQDTVIVAQMQIVQEVLAQNHPEVWLDVRSKMEEKLQ